MTTNQDEKTLALPDSIPSPGEASAKSGDDATPIRDVAVGLALYTASAAWNTVSTAVRLTNKVAGFFFSPVKRVAESPVMKPVRSQFDHLVERGEQQVDGWIQTGLSQESRATETANKVVDPVMDSVVGYLSNHPAIKKLVEDQIAMLAKESPELPELNILVRVLVDNYMVYLNQNPELVQGLITEQGTSMIGEITVEVRQRLVTGDSALEAVVRALFRRRPRPELPGPSVKVQARALQARLPEDFPKLEAFLHDDQ
jgi:hypothetical protein